MTKMASLFVVALFFSLCEMKHLLVETYDDVSDEAGTDYSDYQGGILSLYKFNPIPKPLLKMEGLLYDTPTMPAHYMIHTMICIDMAWVFGNSLKQSKIFW